MKKTIHLLSNGKLKRKDNTLYFINEKGEKQTIPIHVISDINCIGRVTVSSQAVAYCMKEGLIINFFNKYGFYEGSLYPKIQLNAGEVVVKQTEHYLDKTKREYIAKEFVEGIRYNILKTMKYYRRKRKSNELEKYIDNIGKVDINGNIQQIMSSEGRIWDNFYQSFNIILKRFGFSKREIRPPKDEVNSLLSYGNSLLYTSVLGELYRTYLYPSVSYLHEPATRRFSLSLDIADIFKPVIVDRVVFELVNNNKIKEKHFTYDAGVLLNDSGKRIFLKEYDKKLESTIKHPTLNKYVSYKYLLRLEGYKLIRHLFNDQKYNSFKMWW